MESKHLGEIKFSEDEEWYSSRSISLSQMSGKKVVFVFDDLENDVFPDEFDDAIENFISLDDGWMNELRPFLWEYYYDYTAMLQVDEFDPIDKSNDILDHIRVGTEIDVSWDSDEKNVYLSFEGGCDWEPEHGLQITLRDGSVLAKIGPYTGHVTNADTYADYKLEDVIYKGRDFESRLFKSEKEAADRIAELHKKYWRDVSFQKKCLDDWEQRRKGIMAKWRKTMENDKKGD